MPRVESFDPIIGSDPRVLILGSMPGVKSLQAQQYYAHPRNAFWPIMAELFAIEWDRQYQRRIEQLQTLPVALWDVLGSCYREGSLDAAISSANMQVNPIAQLLFDCPGIALIAFNGTTAEKLFRRLVWPNVSDQSGLNLLRLPSTSPAHASMNLEQKLSAWSAINEHLNNLA